jgi:uncharacterized protein (DUF433 family)
MADEQLLERISMNPKVLAGKPVIKGTRLSVEYIVGRLANGASVDDLLHEYANVCIEDVRACLIFASKSHDPSAS